MTIITVKSKFDTIQIYDELLESIKNQNDIIIDLKDNYIIVNITNNENLYVDLLSHKISSHIIKNIQPRMVHEETILEFSGYLDESVEQLIKKITWKLIYKDENTVKDQISIVKQQIKDHFSQDNFLNLDGFINFRLNSTKNKIHEIINEELNQLLDEEEFDNFVDILRQYISIKIPKNELVHFVMIKDKDFEFVTGNRKRLDLNEVNKICNELENSTGYHIDTRDFILGTLMTLSPKNLVIHTNYKQDPNIVYTLKKIYGKRATECQGCEFCESIRSTRDFNNND